MVGAHQRGDKGVISCPCGYRMRAGAARPGATIRCIACQRRGVLGPDGRLAEEPVGVDRPARPRAPRPATDRVDLVLDGRYAIESALGRGGMAMAYMALDRRMNRPVVVKIPHAELRADPVFRERFAREIRSLATVDHPHIVKILDAGEVDRVPYAVLQHLGGGSLRDRIKKAGRPLTIDEIRPWLRQVAEALDHTHGRGIVHRDLTPSNILFDEGGNAFVADFGIARVPDPLDDDRTLTRPDLLPGSIPFMGPESVNGTIGPPYDQYSLATIVYRCLAGQLPHGGTTPMSVLFSKATRPPAPIGELVDGLPSSVEAALERGLSIDPDDRFPSCVALALAIECPSPVAASRRPVVAAPVASAPLRPLEDDPVARLRASRGLTADGALLLVPSEEDTSMARRAIQKGQLGLREALLALDLQERQLQVGERIGLIEVLVDQGLLDAPRARRLWHDHNLRLFEEGDRFVADAVLRLGFCDEPTLRHLQAGRHEAEGSRRVSLGDHLARVGILTLDERDRIHRGLLRARYGREDRLVGEIARRRGLVDAATIARAVERQKEMADRGMAPLPLATVLVGMDALRAHRADAIRRAIRRHRITRLPIERFLRRVLGEGPTEAACA